MGRRDYYDDPSAPLANAIVPAVTAVVLDGTDSLLLIHRTDNDLWALPGGGVELGEDVAGAVRREVLEETGIEVEVTGIVGIYSDPRHLIAYDDGEVRQEFSLCLRARPLTGQARGSSESSEVRWVPAAQIATLDMHPAQRLRIGHALDPGLTSPYIG